MRGGEAATCVVIPMHDTFIREQEIARRQKSITPFSMQKFTSLVLQTSRVKIFSCAEHFEVIFRRIF
jgi:hypothetical protein